MDSLRRREGLHSRHWQSRESREGGLHSFNRRNAVGASVALSAAIAIAAGCAQDSQSGSLAGAPPGAATPNPSASGAPKPPWDDAGAAPPGGSAPGFDFPA